MIWLNLIFAAIAALFLGRWIALSGHITKLIFVTVPLCALAAIIFWPRDWGTGGGGLLLFYPLLEIAIFSFATSVFALAYKMFGKRIDHIAMAIYQSLKRLPSKILDILFIERTFR